MAGRASPGSSVVPDARWRLTTRVSTSISSTTTACIPRMPWPKRGFCPGIMQAPSWSTLSRAEMTAVSRPTTLPLLAALRRTRARARKSSPLAPRMSLGWKRYRKRPTRCARRCAASCSLATRERITLRHRATTLTSIIRKYGGFAGVVRATSWLLCPCAPRRGPIKVTLRVISARRSRDTRENMISRRTEHRLCVGARLTERFRRRSRKIGLQNGTVRGRTRGCRYGTTSEPLPGRQRGAQPFSGSEAPGFCRSDELRGPAHRMADRRATRQPSLR